MTWHLDEYRCTLLRGILRRSFRETSPRNIAENTAEHRGGGVGSVVANHCGGGKNSMVVTTLQGTKVPRNEQSWERKFRERKVPENK